MPSSKYQSSFDVLAVVALAVGQPEQPLLQDRIAAVPQRQRETPAQVVVAPAGNPVLAPAIGAAAGVVVREMVPGRAVGAVILPHRPPLPLAEIGPPVPPRHAGLARRQPPAFGGVEQVVQRLSSNRACSPHAGTGGTASPSSRRIRINSPSDQA